MQPVPPHHPVGPVVDEQALQHALTQEVEVEIAEAEEDEALIEALTAEADRPRATAATHPLDIILAMPDVPSWVTSRRSFRDALNAVYGDGCVERSSAAVASDAAVDSSARAALSLHERDLVNSLSKPSAERISNDLLIITRYLREQPFCADFDGALLERFARAVSAGYHAPGMDLCRQGDEGDYFYMLLKGKVAISVRGVGVVATITEPSTFGELALTSAESRQATCTAVTHVHSLRLHRADYGAMMKGWHEKWQNGVVDFLCGLPMCVAMWGGGGGPRVTGEGFQWGLSSMF